LLQEVRDTSVVVSQPGENKNLLQTPLTVLMNPSILSRQLSLVRSRAAGKASCASAALDAKSKHPLHTCTKHTRTRTHSHAHAHAHAHAHTRLTSAHNSRAMKKTHAKKQIEFAMYTSVDTSTPIGVPSTNSTFARRGVTPGSTGHLALFLFVLHGRRTSGSSFFSFYTTTIQNRIKNSTHILSTMLDNARNHAHNKKGKSRHAECQVVITTNQHTSDFVPLVNSHR